MRPQADDDIAVNVQELRVRRGDRLVLPGISLRIPRGLVTGLLGPSGSGKTTLMRAVVGVQLVESGEVIVLGRPAGTPALRRTVGYVTQAPSVYADLTVGENLRYFAAIHGGGRDSIERVIEAVGLSGHERQVVRSLSGGELSRCSLAAALLGDPQLLVLDEPTVGLDPVLRQQLWRTFHALAAEGRTILISTHVMDEAERCDEIVLMRDGRIVAAAPPRGLLAQTETDDIEQAFLALAEA